MKAKVEITGEIKFLMQADNDVVEGKMLPENADRMIEQAEKVEHSDKFPGYPIAVNDKFFFPEREKKSEAKKR